MTARIFYFSELRSDLDRKVLSDAVLCFGHFNAIHPGHIRYFRTARQYGAPLVVALESDSQLPDAERSSAFPERERAHAVAALEGLSSRG